MGSFPHVLIGGGRAAGQAADTLVGQGIPGSEIALICGEPELPYNRPPLSKGFLLGVEPRESVFFKPPTFYEQQHITVFTGIRATAVGPDAHTVTLEDGRRISYRKLLIATGTTPRMLSVRGSNLLGIFTLRTLQDSERIQAALRTAKHAVVVGASFIGMELASACAQRGLRTTIVHRGTAVLEKLGSPESSQFFEGVFRAHGVEFRFEDEVEVFEGTGSVAAVRTKRSETLPADLVLVGIGVAPDTAFLAGSGIAMENGGVKTNEYLETSAPDVYAAGDVALFHDPLFGKHRRIEHWDTAIQHGKIAGKNMAGGHEAYSAVSFFFSDLFDLSFDYFGDAEGTDTTVLRGSWDKRAVTLFFLKEGVVRAAFTMGRPKERNATIALIKQRTPVDAAALKDPSVPLPSTAQR